MRKIAILGAAESGVGTAILAKKQGFDVFVSDAGEIQSKYKQALCEYAIPWEERGHSETEILSADKVVKSPGIPDSASIISNLMGRGIPIINELEFAKPFSRGKTVCVTGSNGKTTTAKLICHILQQGGIDVGLAGNVGRSFALQVADGDHDWYVLEVSSFQLDNMFDFKADISVLMNITPDHLDRYGFCMQNYVDSKMRIIQNQGEGDYFVYWQGDEHIDEELRKRENSGYAPKPTPSSLPAKVGKPLRCAFNDSDYELLNLQFSQMGQHNKRNAVAAYYVSKFVGVEEAIIRRSLMDFPGVEHRLERVAEKLGVLYINDSKATNVDACNVAIQAMDRPTILIMGGLDKGNDYSTIFSVVKEKCVGLVFLGVDNKKLHDTFDKLNIPVKETHNMKDCVEACSNMAKEGDVVLLSPCCASFDLFRNMEDRGEQFKMFVRCL